MTDDEMENLTPRELEVARLLTLGYRNKQIGGLLTMAHGTVKVHVASIAFKLRAYVGDKEARVMIAAWYRATHGDKQQAA